jgi:hypothetical protein
VRQLACPIGVSSDYAPAVLYRDATPRALVLCPYCLAPLTVGAAICPTCLEDPRNDAPIEEDRDEFLSARRKPCPSCATTVHHLAVRCAGCRQPLARAASCA